MGRERNVKRSSGCGLKCTSHLPLKQLPNRVSLETIDDGGEIAILNFTDPAKSVKVM
jgi:hypothetical protein